MRALTSTVETVAIVTVILIGAVVLGYFLAVTQLPMKLAQGLASSGLSPTGIMVLIIVAYLIMGAFMDELAMILLTVPILFPVTQAIGYDPIWFGVIIVIVCQAGMIAPPVGLNVFVISGMVKDVPMQDIYRGIMPFLVAMVVLLAYLDGGAGDRALPAAHDEIGKSSASCVPGSRARPLAEGRGCPGAFPHLRSRKPRTGSRAGTRLSGTLPGPSIEWPANQLRVCESTKA